MISCLEHDLSKVARIEAVPFHDGHSVLNIPTHIFSHNQCINGIDFAPGYPEPVIATDDLSVATGASTPQVTLIDPTFRVSFVRDTLKCSDKMTRSVSCITHQISLTWDFQPLTADDYAILDALQSTPHDIIITYFGMQRKIIRTDASAYAFDFNDSDGTMKCSMTLTNGQGLTAVI